MLDHPVPHQITIKSPDGSKEKFNLDTWKGGRAFLKKFIFTDEPGLPNNDRFLGALRRVLWERDFGNGLRPWHLAELRALPRRAVHNLRTSRDPATALALTMIINDLVEATAREFRSQHFWLRHGQDKVLLGRRELEELERDLVELAPSFLGPDEEINAAGFTIIKTLELLRHPNFARFSRALP